MYIKIASIIEILLGLAMAGLGVFALLLSGATPGPAAIAGLILGVPMILLGILLVIFGISLWRLKKWAWIASIITLVILIIAIAFFIVGVRAYSQLVPIFLCAGAIICLILLILGKIEIFPAKKKIESLQKIQIERRIGISSEKRIGVSWKKLKFLKPSFAKILVTVILTLPVALALLTATGEMTPALIVAMPFLYIAFPIVVLLSKIIPSTYPDFPGALITIIILALYYYILVCLVIFIYKKISSKIGGGQKIKTFFIPNKEKTILFIVLSILIGCWYWVSLYNPLRPFIVDILKGLLILPLSYLVSCIIFGIWGRDRRKTLLVVLIVIALIAVGAIGYYFYKEKKAEESIDETADLSPEDLSTEDWEIYQNEGHGFSFSYPENFQLLEDDFGRGSLLASTYIEEPILFSLVLLQDIYIDSAQTPQISIDVVKTNKTIGQLLDYVRKIINEQAKILENPGAPYYGAPPPEIKSVETVTIGDLKMTKVVHDIGPGGPNPILLEYYIAYPGYVFVFSANYGSPCSPGYCGETEKEILPIILSTFKFIEISEDEITGYNKPQVITLSPPGVIETNSITLRAKILDSGGVDIDDVSWEFECGKASGIYTEKLKYSSGGRTGKIPQEYSRKVVNLSIATTYYCRAKSCNSAGCGYGKEIFFQTGPYYEGRGGNVDTVKKIVMIGGKNINISNDTKMYCFEDLRKCSLDEICREKICGPYQFALTVQYYVEDSNYYAHKLIYAPQ